MLENIITLGNSLESSDAILNYISVAKLGKTKSILAIVVDGDNNSYVGINHEDKKSNVSDTIKYLYSAGPSNGADKTPTSLITEPDKTFNKKILKWFEKHKNKDILLDKIHEILISNADQIIKDIQKEKENIPKERDQNVLLTIKIKEENSERFIGQNNKVIEILKSQFESDIKTDITSPIILQCLFCNQNKEMIPGKLKISDIFSFSTFDKKGFLYNFDESNKNKQIPTCKDCYINLKRGKEWLDRYTYFNFEGYKYYLIPSINDYSQNQSTFKYFIKLAEKYQSAKTKKKQQNLQYENGLMQEEEDLLESMVKDGFNLTLEFLFVSLKGSGKYMDIERHIEDVPLTWIRKIYNVYKDILNLQIFNENSMKNIVGQKWEGPLRNKKREMYLAALIKFFFPSDSLDIEFLTVISNILEGRPINSDVMYRAFLRKIRNDIYENYFLAKMNTIKSFVLFLILKKLKLITYSSSNSINHMSSYEKELFSDIDSIKDFEGVLDSEGKKALFYEGALTGKLLSIQYANRSSTPFLDKLHGLHISFTDARYLLPKIISKLREYQAAYTSIEKQIANMFILSETSGQTLSDDESSYYFTLGMLLHSQIK